MTNEYLQGYFAALKNIKQFIKNYSQSDPMILGQQCALEACTKYIDHVENNYKQLIGELNDQIKNQKT